MTAREIVTSALTRLGYTGTNGNERLTSRLMKKSVDTVNDVYADLWEIVNDGDAQFTPVTTLSDKVNLPQRALRVMVYGVAAFLAQSENDGDGQQWWMTVYNSLRTGLSKITRRRDVLPTLPEGWME